VPYLRRIGVSLPEKRASVAELCADLGLSGGQARLHTRFLGQERVAVADDRDLVDLLVPAARDSLAGTDPERVRCLVYAHTMPFVARPGDRVLERVRARLGLTNAIVFGLTEQRCSSSLYALRLADHLLAGLDAGDRVLVLTGEKALSTPPRPRCATAGRTATG
jgi:3-oxoacyl-[acyl-carrier-protein] synthase III